MSCPDCFSGAIMADYQAKGTISTLHNLPTYIAPQPTSPKGIIIIISDAFGMQFPNNKHLADTYASHGYTTYLPDFMDGIPAPSWMLDTLTQVMDTSGDLWSWLTKPYYLTWTLIGFLPFKFRHSYPKSMPKVRAFFEAVRTSQPSLPIAAAGFCWGGQHTVSFASGLRILGSEQLYCDAQFTAHPSNLSFPADIQNVTQPLSIAVPEKDFVFNVDLARKSEVILREKEEKGTGPKDWEIRYYKGANHGFAVRANPGNKEVVKQADEAVEQALEFFERVFKGWKGEEQR